MNEDQATQPEPFLAEPRLPELIVDELPVDDAVPELPLRPERPYHVVVVPNGGCPEYASFATLGELQQFLKRRPFHRRDCFVYCFEGWHMPITKPPRHLVCSDNTQLSIQPETLLPELEMFSQATLAQLDDEEDDDLDDEDPDDEEEDDEDDDWEDDGEDDWESDEEDGEGEEDDEDDEDE